MRIVVEPTEEFHPFLTSDGTKVQVYTRENASVSVAVKSNFLIESDVKEHKRRD